jgi:RNA polymerase sigma-70 factor, ECF subfamily
MKSLDRSTDTDVRSLAPENDNSGRSAAAALHAAIARCRPALYDRAQFLTQDRSTADDLVQATLEKAMVACDRLRPGTNIQAWLNKILRNLFIDTCRGRRRVTSFEGDLVALEPDELDPLDLITADDLGQAVAELRPRQREIFEYAYRDHLSYREISARLAVPTSTVGTRLTRVKAKLRDRLERVFAERQKAPSFRPSV